MKTQRLRSSHRAFSLIEILVVVSIIALLVGIALPAVNGAMNRARRLQAMNTLVGVTTALRNYHGDCQRFPLVTSGGVDQTFELTGGSPLLKVLLGENVDRSNPREMNYLGELQIGKQGAGGLVGQEGSYGLMDPWGTPYRVTVDGDADGRVPNPDAQNQDPAIAALAPAQLLFSVIGSSAGPDKRFGTTDDVASWRR